MPKLSPTMSEGTIAKWHKKVGDFVEAGDLLLEIATDKATVEHNALDPGFLRKILCNPGEKAAVNAPLAILTENEKESIDGYEPEGVVAPAPKSVTAAAPKPVVAPVKPVAKAAPAPVAAPKPVAPAPKAVKPQEKEATHVLASPLAKTLAKERGIDINRVKGTGPHGRILSRDLDRANLPQIQESEEESQEHEEIALTPMRKVIAERLQFAKSTIPHFYVRMEVDVDALVKLREETKKFEMNVTVNDFIVKACAIALKRHPGVNASFDQDRDVIIRHSSVDLAIAVTIQGGLITPIVRHSEKKSLLQLSKEVKTLAGRAKEGKLTPEEYQGGSFTISNLGMFGVADFQAIVNPPQAAILAVGAVQEKPIVKNGAIAVGKILNLTLSCDHRAVDGSDAAQFLQTMKQLLENPILFLAE